MYGQGEILAHVLPTSTSAVTAYQNVLDIAVEVTLMVITTTAAAGTTAIEYQIYHDDAGTSYADATLLVRGDANKDGFDKIFNGENAGSGVSISPGGSIGFQSAVANQLKLTLYGVSQPTR